jgi:hypothetical protein
MYQLQVDVNGVFVLCQCAKLYRQDINVVSVLNVFVWLTSGLIGRDTLNREIERCRPAFLPPFRPTTV